MNNWEVVSAFLQIARWRIGDTEFLSSQLKTKTQKFCWRKRHLVFVNLKDDANLVVALGFVLKKVENGSSHFSYAHENNKLSERSKHLATKDSLTKNNHPINNSDVI